MKQPSIIFCGLILMAGCAQTDLETPATAPVGDVPGAETEAEVQERSIFGSLTYRQRIALPQGAVANLAVRRVEATGEEVLAEQSFALNGRQVPIPFEITASEESDGAANESLSFTATILDNAGELLWQTEDAVSFVADNLRNDLGMVMLSPAGNDEVILSDVAGRDWMIARLNGEPVLTSAPIVLRFDENGQISGNASCNAYTASGTIENSILSIGPIALTRKACMPEVMAQETFFLDLMENVSQIRIDETGLLTMTSDWGETLTAR
ncbi:META domain-containing protein [Henriciella barbarensis]|uniref:META domain-containing protein n=1 Tax=Henriciella barbarensis TaxID=86342 RepID=A0A399R2R4_9PROT|nr:META domain-containing protein [Henriciella barbarensis]RIJ24515.1 META domain-containing protein [Henriciella barbarensis]